MKAKLKGLEKQLEATSTLYKAVREELREAKEIALVDQMAKFIVPDGFRIATRQYQIALMQDGQNWESARVNIENTYDYQGKREYVIVASVNANGGSSVDDLLAQAKFVQFVSPRLSAIEGAINGVSKEFAEVIKTTEKELQAVETQIGEVKFSIREASKKAILEEMKSEQGFSVSCLTDHWGHLSHPCLELKFDYHTYALANVRIDRVTASGKSADVTIKSLLNDNTLRTTVEKNVRMTNIDSLISIELLRREKAQEGEIEIFTVDSLQVV